MKQIRLSKGLYALVSDQDFPIVSQFKWCASFESRNTKVYAIRRERGRKIRMHRFIYEQSKGAVPGEYVIDHKNHNSLDNRRVNLEAVTQRENMLRSPGWKKKGMRVQA